MNLHPDVSESDKRGIYEDAAVSNRSGIRITAPHGFRVIEVFFFR